MRTEVLEIKRACFCLPLRYSLLIWGYARLISTAFYIYLKIVTLTNFKSLEEDSFESNIYWQVSTSTLILLDFILVLIFIIGAHKKSVKLLKTFYFYDIGVLILETLYYPALLIYILQIYIKIGIDKDLVKSALSIAAYITILLIINVYVLLLVRSEIIKLSNNSQFRFENNAAESECTMEYKRTGDEEQGLQKRKDENFKPQDNCPEIKGKLKNASESNKNYKKLDEEEEITVVEEIC